MRATPRSAFPHFQAIPTRWMDNDIHGHVNNVVYDAYFDTAVNQLLIERGVLDIHKGEVVGFVVDSGTATTTVLFRNGLPSVVLRSCVSVL